MQLIFFKWVYLWLLFSNFGLFYGNDSKERRVLGYNCGNEYFSHNDAEFYAKKGLAIKDTASEYPKLFKGSLYDNRLEYYIWPLTPFRNVPNPKVRPYFVVFNPDSEVIDVVTQMGNQKFIKCLPDRENSQKTAQNAHEQLNGHQCPGKFFHDEFVLESVSMGQQMDASKSKSSYICKSFPFKGIPKLVCPLMGELVEEYEFSDKTAQPMLSSLKNKDLALPGGLSSLYNVVIDNDGKVADVVVVLLEGGFMSCPRARGSSYTAKIRSPVSRISNKNGFQCTVKFFDFKYIKSIYEFLRSPPKELRKSKYPRRYYNPHNSEEYWMWPLLPTGEIYLPKGVSKYTMYFAILKKNYEVVRVFEYFQAKKERECPRTHNSVI